VRARRRLATIAGIAAVALVATTGLTLAQGGAFSRLSQRSATDSANAAGETVAAKATCPGNKHLVSGGFSTNLDFDGPIMTRSGAKHGSWASAGNIFELSIGENYKVTSFAYCAQRAPEESVEKASTMVQPAKLGSATAKCPPGTRAIAGGFATRYNGDKITGNVMYESRRLGQTKWRASAVHTFGPQAGGPTKLTAIAYCGDSPRLKTVSDSTHLSNSHPKGSATAKCPHGTRAVSGGFKGTTIQDMSGFESPAPRSSRRASARSWKSATGMISGGSFKWTAYAYCARK
jgi:hypothetical protein